MQTFYGAQELLAAFGADGIDQSVVTIGKFDGIHLGHQQLIRKAVENSDSLTSVLVTFDRHPDSILNPDNLRLPLIGQNQKRELISQLGIDVLLVLPFDAELANQTGEVFAKEIFCELLGAKTVVVGPDFRFGRGGACDLVQLGQIGAGLGFEVETIEEIMLDGKKVSTRAIRDALDVGNIKLANAMFGRVHTTVGLVEHGLKIGRTIGFPTANIARDAEGYLPLDGVYAGWLTADGIRYPAAHSVGVNETFQAVPRLVESHVLDTKVLDLYDKVVTLEYVDFIRPAAKFNGVEDLVEAINRDLDKIRVILGL